MTAPSDRSASPKGGRSDGGPQRASAYAWYVLLVMVLVYAFSLIDRQILSILAEDIKADLDLTDAQLGYLFGTAFAIFYTVFGIPLGRLADSWLRTRLMATGLALWSAMTMLSGLAGSFGHLAAARIGVGVGEASASPAAYSILGSSFPKRQRALAIAIYSAGSYFGTGISLPLGGWLSDGWNQAHAGDAPFGLAGWQFAFFAVGAPGILLALWVLSLREPPRFSADGTPQPVVRPDVWRLFLADLMSILPPFTILAAARIKGGLIRNLTALGLISAGAAGLIRLTGDASQWITYGFGLYAIVSWIQSLRTRDAPAYELIWKRRTFAWCVFGLGCAGMTWNVSLLWASPYAMRTFGVSASEIGPLIGLPGAFAAVVGSITGGFLADRWKLRDPRGRLFVCMMAAAVPIPLVLLMFTRKDLDTYLLLAPLIYFFASTIVAAAVTALQDLVLPRMYGTVGALYLVGNTMVAISLGPYVSGKISTVTGSLQMGVFAMLISPIIALIVLWQVARRTAAVERDKFGWAEAAGEPREAM